MANAGIDALSTGVAMQKSNPQDPNWFAADLNRPRPVELENLIKNVFAHQDTIDDSLPELKKQTMYKYRMNIRNLKLRKVHGTASSALHCPSGASPFTDHAQLFWKKLESTYRRLGL
jgi:hypothetical protein